MRTQETDYFHNFRFHVTCEGPGGIDYIGATEAGFNMCSIPEMTLEAVEYREGIWSYTRKFPGLATVSEVTLGRGVTRSETKFFAWAIKAIEGGAYRATMTIYHFHRVGKEPAEQASPRDDLTNARQIKCEEALPVRLKPAADLDAMTSDVSIAEMDVACERFSIKAPDGPENPADWVPEGYLSIE